MYYPVLNYYVLYMYCWHCSDLVVTVCDIVSPHKARLLPRSQTSVCNLGEADPCGGKMGRPTNVLLEISLDDSHTAP